MCSLIIRGPNFSNLLYKNQIETKLETDKVICFDFDDYQSSLPDFFAVASKYRNAPKNS